MIGDVVKFNFTTSPTAIPPRPFLRFTVSPMCTFTKTNNKVAINYLGDLCIFQKGTGLSAKRDRAEVNSGRSKTEFYYVPKEYDRDNISRSAQTGCVFRYTPRQACRYGSA